jgi:hypothetical protein
MILIILLIVILVTAIGLHSYIKKNSIIMNESIAGGICLVLYVVSSVLIVVIAILFPINYSDQITDYQRIRQYEKQKVIYQKKCDILLPEFERILLDKYPQFEKKIYDKITVNNYMVYLVKYPELKNIEATKALIDNININYSSIYDMDLKIEEMKANIRMRNSNIFMLVPHYEECINE